MLEITETNLLVAMRASIHESVRNLFPSTSSKVLYDAILSKVSKSDHTKRSKTDAMRAIVLLPAETIDSYHTRIINASYECFISGVQISEYDVFAQLLFGLPTNYEMFKVQNNLWDPEDLTGPKILKVIAQIKEFELTIPTQSPTSPTANTAKIMLYDATKFCQCHGYGHSDADCVVQKSGNPWQPSTKCKWESQNGAFKSGTGQTPPWKKQPGSAQLSKLFQSLIVQQKVPRKEAFSTQPDTTKPEKELLKLFQAFLVSTAANKAVENYTISHIDSACTPCHMSPIKPFDMTPTDIQVSVANGDMIPSLGIGSSTIEIDGRSLALKDTLYVPNLKDGLISVPALVKDNKTVTFDDNLCTIIDKTTNVHHTIPLDVKTNLWSVVSPKSQGLGRGLQATVKGATDLDSIVGEASELDLAIPLSSHLSLLPLQSDQVRLTGDEEESDSLQVTSNTFPRSTKKDTLLWHQRLMFANED
jgi:hypothetical protein